MALLVLLVAIALWCWHPWTRTGNAGAAYRGATHDDKEPEETSEEVQMSLPRITVIVYTEDGVDEIEECVSKLMRQDYPDKEVVVVCRTTASSRELISGRLSAYDNVYVTFIPPTSHNLSERKLAITIGLKAASGDIVLTTAANIRPASDSWLSRMASHFVDPRIEMVLGYSRMEFGEMRGPGRWYRQFDSVLTAGQWIGNALGGNPYRGDGYNLAFRRSTFFAHKGYARNIFLHYGDDDLFVHELATAENTAVEISPEAQVVTTWGEQCDRMWTLRKSRYQFTSRWLPARPFMMAAAVSWCNWLIPAVGVAMALVGWPSWFAVACPALCWLTLQAFQIRNYRRMASALGAVKLWLAVPLFFLIHPVLNGCFKLSNRRLRKVNYTWQR